MKKGTLLLLSVALLGLAVQVMPASGQADDGHPGFLAASGRITFQRYCASCHGREADGNGAVADVLKVRPADLRMLSMNNDGEYPSERIAESIDGRKAIAAHGRRDMPVWGEVFQTPLVEGAGRPGEGEEDRAARKIRELVFYIETIQLEESDSDDGR